MEAEVAAEPHFLRDANEHWSATFLLDLHNSTFACPAAAKEQLKSVILSEMDTSEVVEVSGINKYLNYSFKCNEQKLMASDGIPDKLT